MPSGYLSALPQRSARRTQSGRVPRDDAEALTAGVSRALPEEKFIRPLGKAATATLVAVTLADREHRSCNESTTKGPCEQVPGSQSQRREISDVHLSRVIGSSFSSLGSHEKKLVPPSPNTVRCERNEQVSSLFKKVCQSIRFFSRFRCRHAWIALAAKIPSPTGKRCVAMT